MSNKVVVRLLGGLGNQLFCYAAGKRLAIVNNADLVIDDISGFSNDYRYQRFSQIDHFNVPSRKARRGELLAPFSRVRRKVIKYSNSRKNFYDRSYVTQEFIDFDQRLLDFRFKGTVFLEGYWQSEKYFEDVSEAVKSDLIVSPPVDKKNCSMAQRIRTSHSVAVHVRFFDKPGEEMHGNNVRVGYYTEAINYIEKKYPNSSYFLFSDLPEQALQLLPVDQKKVTCVNINKGDDSAYADLWLMSLCKKFIIANSTFSWWAAWLSNEKDKLVISPGMVKGNLTAWGFDGLIPDNWVVIE